MKSNLVPCVGCGANLKPCFLKDGRCNGCRNPQLIVEAVMPKHTPEPWLVSMRPGASIVVQTLLNDYYPVAFVQNPYGTSGTDNAERIVACVNACAGIANPEVAVRNLVKEATLALVALHELGVPVVKGAPYDVCALEDALDAFQVAKRVKE